MIQLYKARLVYEVDILYTPTLTSFAKKNQTLNIHGQGTNITGC